jgi:hypothetical protein
MNPQFPWGDALVIVALTVLAVMIANAVRRRNGPGLIRLRRRLECPLERRPATVDFVVVANGGATYVDVAACSLLPPDRPVECDRVCRSTSVAPFSEPAGTRRGRTDGEDTDVRVA